MESFNEKAERVASFYEGLQKEYLETSNKRQNGCLLRDFYFRLYHDAVFVTEAIQALAEVRKELLKETPDIEKMRNLVKWDER